jgi:hypothetical protein
MSANPSILVGDRSPAFEASMDRLVLALGYNILRKVDPAAAVNLWQDRISRSENSHAPPNPHSGSTDGGKRNGA